MHGQQNIKIWIHFVQIGNGGVFSWTLEGTCKTPLLHGLSCRDEAQFSSRILWLARTIL